MVRSKNLDGTSTARFRNEVSVLISTQTSIVTTRLAGIARLGAIVSSGNKKTAAFITAAVSELLCWF